MDLMVEATARRVFSNAHTYHINSISVNSDLQTFISTDDLRINLWNLEITDRSFSILLFCFFFFFPMIIIVFIFKKDKKEKKKTLKITLNSF